MEEQQITNRQQFIPPMYSPSPVGIGGWLILPVIGLVIVPFRVLYLVLNLFSTSFSPEVIRYFGSPDSPMYSPLYKPLIIGEAVVNLFLGAAAIVLLIFLFSKKRVFPKLMVAYLVFSMCYTIGDTALAKLAVPQMVIDSEMIRTILGSVIAACVWAPYFLLSKRVKNTFVR